MSDGVADVQGQCPAVPCQHKTVIGMCALCRHPRQRVVGAPRETRWEGEKDWASLSIARAPTLPPPPHPPSLPPFTAHTTHRTKSIFTLSWRTRSRAHITAYERSSLCISVSEGLIRNGQSRLEQWIKHLSRAILYNTVLTVRADIQRKWLKACANYHVSHPDAGFFSQWQVVACNILQSGFHRLNRKCLLSAAFDRVGRLFARAPGVLCRLVWQRCQKWNNKPVWQRVNIVAVFPNI